MRADKMMELVDQTGNLQDRGMVSGFSGSRMGLPVGDLAELVNMDSPRDVFEEIKGMVSDVFPDFDFESLDTVFNDILKLFRGEYPGYRSCNTRYHDLKHTTDAFLAMGRMMHGAVLQGIGFSQRLISLGLISALMHDTGYIQSAQDQSGTGGKYTLVHVKRSIDFMQAYFSSKGFSDRDLETGSRFLKCTGLETRIFDMAFDSPEEGMIGRMLGAADIFGQLADSTYLNKLQWLYREFQEADVPGYRDELDLFEKTPLFFEFTLKRAEAELGGVHHYLRHHFRARWQVDRNLYFETAERNIGLLKKILDTCSEFSDDRSLAGLHILSRIQKESSLHPGKKSFSVSPSGGFSFGPVPPLRILS